MEQSVRNKSNVGIWTRIKNIYNNSPWHAAFTYPIAYMISTAAIGGVLASRGLESIGWFFLFIFYLTPLWVLFGLIVSKKRLPYLLSLIIGLVIPALLAVVAYKGFKEAEINSGIKRVQAKYLSKIINYKNFSNRETKELSIKLFLLDRCEGGQKAIDKMRDFDSNAEIYSCMELLRLNIKKENLPSSKTELEVLKYLNTVNFGKALDNYKNFINE
jgi:hypothetical protein